MLRGVTHIGIDQKGSIPALRKHGREICGKPAAAVASIRACDRQRLALCKVEPAKRQLAAQRTQGLHDVVLRIIASDDVISDTMLSAAQEDRVIKLLC